MQVIETFFHNRDIVDFHRPGQWENEIISPFSVAIKRNIPRVVEVFLDNRHLINLDLQATDSNGMTPLQLAVSLGLKTIPKMISMKLNE